MPSNKRSAANSGNDAKKHKKTPVEQNVTLLAEGFDNAAYDFPCAESLKPMIHTVLCVPVENRHEFQARVFAMVEEAVCEARDSLVARRAELQNEIANGDRVRVEMEENVATTNGEIEKVEKEIETAETCVKEATDNLQAGQTALDEEIRKLADERVDFDKHTAAYTELDTKFVQLFLNGAMKEFVQDAGHRKSLEALVKKFIVVDDSNAHIVEASYPALYKEPSTRTKFDTHALDLFEDMFENKLSAIKKLIAQTKPDFSRRDSLEAEVEKLTQALEEEKTILNTAKSTRKDLLAKLKALEKRLKSHPMKMKEVESALSAVVDTLECFNSTVVPANKFLQEYTEVVEEAPKTAIEEDVVMEEPASRIEAVQTPMSRVEGLQTPMNRVEAMQTPANRADTVQTPMSRAEPLHTPMSRVGGMQTPMSHGGGMQTPVTRGETPQRSVVGEPMAAEQTPQLSVINEMMSPEESSPRSPVDVHMQEAESACSGTPYHSATPRGTPGFVQEPMENASSNMMNSPQQVMKPTPSSLEHGSRDQTPMQYGGY